jgi:hypothetical protein
MNPSSSRWDSFRSEERFTPVYVRISSGLRRGGFLEGGGGGGFLPDYGWIPSGHQGEIRFVSSEIPSSLHWKKRLLIFPSGCHKADSPWAGNNLIFRPGRVWLVKSRLGTGKSLAFFTVYVEIFLDFFFGGVGAIAFCVRKKSFRYIPMDFRKWGGGV